MSLSSSSGRVSYAPSNSSVVDPATTGTFIAKINNVNLGLMGLVGGLSPGFTQGDLKALERFAIKAGVYEALKKQVATSIDALTSRELIPKLDFEDGNSNPITLSEWRQPWSGAYTFVENTPSTNGKTMIYQTNKTVDYDRKVIVLYGVRAVSTGPGRPSGQVEAPLMELSDSVGNVYDLWHLQGLDTAGVLYAYAPVVYSTNKAMTINMYPSSTSSGHFDTIEIIGKVIESIGDHVMGTRYSQFE